MLDEKTLNRLSDAENIPISDIEACAILNLKSSVFNKAVESEIIKKSVSIHYRFGRFINFVGFYDVFEYALRRDFFFLNYGQQAEVNELVGGVVDEMAFLIDCYSSSCTDLHFSESKIKESLIYSCMLEENIWRKYWLYKGDTFAAEKCSEISLKTWRNTYCEFIKYVHLY